MRGLLFFHSGVLFLILFDRGNIELACAVLLVSSGWLFSDWWSAEGRVRCAARRARLLEDFRAEPVGVSLLWAALVLIPAALAGAALWWLLK